MTGVNRVQSADDTLGNFCHRGRPNPPQRRKMSLRNHRGDKIRKLGVAPKMYLFVPIENSALNVLMFMYKYCKTRLYKHLHFQNFPEGDTPGSV